MAMNQRASVPPAATDRSPSARADERGRQLDSVAWALFFIWIGVSLLANVSWGWFLVGVGVLILGVELLRRQMDLPVDGFWVACGVAFLAAGLWLLFGLAWPVTPILLILFGTILLGKALLRLGQ